MASNNAIAIQLWEDNPDTPLRTSNLSKTIDIQADSKYIYLTNSESDMLRWADYVINSATWPVGSSTYTNKIVYNMHASQRNARRGTISYSGSTAVYDWDTTIISPYNKLLKIMAKTKISMSYYNIIKSTTDYISFDIGPEDKVFTYEDVLIDTGDFATNTEYEIYLYFTKFYNDYATVKIVRKDQTNQSWKTLADDISSPTGKKVVAYRKIGGFKTDSSRQIIEDSIWDYNTLRKEVIAEQYKVYKEGQGISLLKAENIPIADSDHLFPNETNVEGALADAKGLLENLRRDTYTDNRFGVRLIYSPLKKVSNSLVPCVANEISLKITAGHLDVFGTRVKITEDIYLASPTTELRVSDGSWRTGVSLGPEDIENKNKIHVNPNGSSLIWRVFITDSGKIYLKKPSDLGGMPIWSSSMGGWYDTSTGGTGSGRCIGKFQVSLSGSYYIDKMSITDTYDQNLPTNNVLVFHGMFCPDGLVPCDGKWHDVTGDDPNSYDVMPAYSLWTGGRWYEETPDMRDRTIKGAPLPVLNNSGGPFNSTTRSGGSKDCGASNDLSNAYHLHTLVHDHGTGTIRISSSGQHASHSIEWQGTATTSFQVTEMIPGSYAAAYDHRHNIIIGGGDHSHGSESFIGRTEQLAGNNAESSEASSWAPYKEILYCIKK